MRLLRNIKSEWALRIGFCLMYLYSGSDLFTRPEHWYGFAPQWFIDMVTRIMPFDSYLKIQGVGELVIAFVCIAWFLPRIFVRIGSILNVIEMAGILLLSGIDTITFRDIGLLGGGIALLLLVFSEKGSSVQ